MSETNAYKNFRANMLRPGDRIERVENVCVDGMPDVNCCLEGVEFWMEIKSPTEPKRPTTKLFGSNHPVSQDQKNWFLAQKLAGGKCFLLIQTDKRWMLLPGALVDFANSWTVNQIIDNSVWVTTRPVRSKEQWESLRAALRKR